MFSSTPSLLWVSISERFFHLSWVPSYLVSVLLPIRFYLSVMFPTPIKLVLSLSMFNILRGFCYFRPYLAQPTVYRFYGFSALWTRPGWLVIWTVWLIYVFPYAHACTMEPFVRCFILHPCNIGFEASRFSLLPALPRTSSLNPGLYYSSS